MLDWIQSLAEPSLWWLAGLIVPVVVIGWLNKKCPIKLRLLIVKYLPTVLDEAADVIDSDTVNFSHEEKVTPIMRKLADKIESDVEISPADKVKLENMIKKVVKKKMK